MAEQQWAAVVPVWEWRSDLGAGRRWDLVAIELRDRRMLRRDQRTPRTPFLQRFLLELHLWQAFILASYFAGTIRIRVDVRDVGAKRLAILRALEMLPGLEIVLTFPRDIARRVAGTHIREQHFRQDSILALVCRAAYLTSDRRPRFVIGLDDGDNTVDFAEMLPWSLVRSMGGVYIGANTVESFETDTDALACCLMSTRSLLPHMKVIIDSSGAAKASILEAVVRAQAAGRIEIAVPDDGDPDDYGNIKDI